MATFHIKVHLFTINKLLISMQTSIHICVNTYICIYMYVCIDIYMYIQ